MVVVCAGLAVSPPTTFSFRSAAVAAADIFSVTRRPPFIYLCIYTLVVHECLAKPTSHYGDTKNSHAARPRPGSPCTILSNVACPSLKV